MRLSHGKTAGTLGRAGASARGRVIPCTLPRGQKSFDRNAQRPHAPIRARIFPHRQKLRGHGATHGGRLRLRSAAGSIRRALDRHRRGHGAPHRGPKRLRRAAGSIHPPRPRQPPEGPRCASGSPQHIPPRCRSHPSAAPQIVTRGGHGAPHRGPKRLRRAAGSIHPPRPRQPPEGPQCSIW